MASVGKDEVGLDANGIAGEAMFGSMEGAKDESMNRSMN